MKALDLCAGTGWSVACQRLGITDYGVELMPEAVATREAAGMVTSYLDVWDGLELPDLVPAHDLLIASPPCQTFSPAGKGSGRAALDDVLALIASGAWRKGDTSLRDAASAAGLDPRTALVLSPLAYVAHYRPTYIALEQVPPVLPVWQAMAVVLRDLGYSVAVEVLHAEQYGVPQTRRRAVLIARRDGRMAFMPHPTHARYIGSANTLGELGVAPWVSAADALGHDPNGVAGFPRRADSDDIIVLGGVSYRARDLRTLSAPAQTVTEKARSWLRWHDGDPDPVRVTAEEAAVLQTFPRDFPFAGTNSRRFLQIGNAVPPLLAEAVLGVFL